ncbi:DUF262 domain-containing protein [Nocardia sp. NPDC050710]|uniref:DUF262 domain-containing protein n=1 Tax=Nocardia sp. NPDC050710 TaxID=3157220 RepID=UPI0033D9DB98
MELDGSNPEHYPIADFLNWHTQKELILNPEFQRGAIWQPAARSYLIDSILRGYPIPKLLMRTRIDRPTRKTIRDVVDGQQRLRTIIDFANNKLILGSKAGNFNRMRFDDLEDDLQDRFLAYKLTSEQLINASDEDVLEVFLRINSYTIPVNPAELRNAKFSSAFSYAVKESVTRASRLWDLGVIPSRSRVRMADQTLIAEIYGYLANGVSEGGESVVTKLYEQFDGRDSEFPDPYGVDSLITRVIEIVAPFRGQRIVRAPHFLMIVAVLGFLEGIIPSGRIDVSNLGDVPAEFDLDIDFAQEGLGQLNDALNGEIHSHGFDIFIDAASSSTQRMRSRQIRFDFIYRALAG